MPELDVLLAICCKFGPVTGDRRGQLDQAAVDEHQAGQAGNGLRGRPDVDDGVPAPGARAGAVSETTPDVDDGFAVDIDCDARTDLLAGGDVVGQRRADLIERLVTVSV